MNKNIKNCLLMCSIIIVLFLIIWFVYDIVKTKPVDANLPNTNLIDENTGLDNIINELFDNVEVTNKQKEVNTVTNQQKEENKEDNSKNEEVENNNDNTLTTESITSKQEKAIALVKKQWGEDENVYFTYQSIDNEGRYIVTVNGKDTTVLAWFSVDVDKGLVTKQ